MADKWRVPYIELGLTFWQPEKGAVADVHHRYVLHDVGARPDGWPLAQYVVAGGGTEAKLAVDLQLGRFVGLQADRTDERAVR